MRKFFEKHHFNSIHNIVFKILTQSGNFLTNTIMFKKICYKTIGNGISRKLTWEKGTFKEYRIAHSRLGGDSYKRFCSNLFGAPVKRFSILSEQTPESTLTNSSALPTNQCRLFQGQENLSLKHLPQGWFEISKLLID